HRGAHGPAGPDRPGLRGRAALPQPGRRARAGRRRVTGLTEAQMTTIERPALAALADPALLPDPYPVLAALREASPFAAAGGAVGVGGRRAPGPAARRAPRASGGGNRARLAPPERRARRAPSFLSLAPPDHTRLRRLVAKAFAPRVIAGLAPRIRQLCDELL